MFLIIIVLVWRNIYSLRSVQRNERRKPKWSDNPSILFVISRFKADEVTSVCDFLRMNIEWFISFFNQIHGGFSVLVYYLFVVRRINRRIWLTIFHQFECGEKCFWLDYIRSSNNPFGAICVYIDRIEGSQSVVCSLQSISSTYMQ